MPLDAIDRDGGVLRRERAKLRGEEFVFDQSIVARLIDAIPAPGRWSEAGTARTVQIDGAERLCAQAVKEEGTCFGETKTTIYGGGLSAAAGQGWLQVEQRE